MTVYQLIRSAIINRRQVIATYRGYRREMCPHIIGIKRGTRDTHQALFYQFGGGSRSGLGPAGSPENWRCIKLDELSNVSTRAGAWHTAPNYSSPHRCVDVVDVEVGGG